MSVEFVDTNILIYAHDSTAGTKQHQASELIARLAQADAAAISTQVLIEFYAAVGKKFRDREIDPDALTHDWIRWMKVHRLDVTDIFQAAALQRQFQISWFDALILNSALELGCSTLWTEDFNDGQLYSTVTVRNPFA
jgi:predicted nucleic acid-binding protein